MRRATLAVVATLVVAACAGRPATVGPVAGTRTAGCGPVEVQFEQGGSHLIGDAEPPVPYNSVPPTSGWHRSGAVDVAVHGPDDPLSEPAQVSVLEAGGVVIAYHELPEADLAAIEDLVRGSYAGRVAVTPYDKLAAGQVATTAYGALQVCDGLDLQAVTAFIDAHAEPEVRPGHG